MRLYILTFTDLRGFGNASWEVEKIHQNMKTTILREYHQIISAAVSKQVIF